MRLDRRIAELFGLSRRAALAAVRQGQVDINGTLCLEPGHTVQPEARVVYHANRPRVGTTARRLHVLYEDPYILIINKPARLLTQPTPARERDTLLERAGRYLARKHERKKPFVGIVQRLDQDTTGAILIVTDFHALRPFQAMFRAHTIERVYVGLVEGIPSPPEGRVDLPLVRDRGDGRRGASHDSSQGVPAVTHFRVLETFSHVASMIECRLETGRTHQVRIHLAEIGHPVIGDAVYRPRTSQCFPIVFGRQALHAQSLRFVHPFSHELIDVQAALAHDMAELAAELRDRFG
jgi:23S rRNA pseudouridine1911/1915/1917 synthase